MQYVLYQIPACVQLETYDPNKVLKNDWWGIESMKMFGGLYQKYHSILMSKLVESGHFAVVQEEMSIDEATIISRAVLKAKHNNN